MLKRWVAGILVAVAGGALLWLGILVYPTPLFAHHARIDAYTVHSDRPLPVAIEATLADVTSRQQAMESAAVGETTAIFLCHSPRRYALFTLLVRRSARSQAFGLSALRSVFVSMQRLEQFAANDNHLLAHSRFEGNLASAIAHEIAHFEVVDALGLEATRRLPTWKLEGWADYQANLAAMRRDPAYDLALRIDRLDDPRLWRDSALRARSFYAWQLLVEYLASERGYGLEELSSPSVTESTARREMREWHQAHRREPTAP